MKLLLSLITLSLMAFPLWGQAQDYSKTSLIVKMKNSKAFPQSKLIRNGKRLFGKVFVVRTEPENLAQLYRDLKSDKQVSYIELNYKSGKKPIPRPIAPSQFFNKSLPKFEAFNDPKTSKIWSFLDAKFHGVSVNKAYMNAISEAKEEIVVAVVDTGVDYNHEDLKNVMWTNRGEIPGNNIDDDNNGYVDDYHGINTIVRDQYGIATGDPMDGHGHGTHCAGTIGAEQNNNTGISGIASNVKIMAIRTVPNDGDETDVNVIESYVYAAQNGARIISCSFGKVHNEGGMAVSEAIDYIGKNYGTLVIAAAGNESSDNDEFPKYPAAYTNENLLVIAASNKYGDLSYFSNFGKIGVDLAAPGSEILSTFPKNNYRFLSGTSMATPTTAGVAAEVLSHHPELNGVELKNVLMNTVNHVEKFEEMMVTEGRVDLFNALQSFAK